jgi:hypothetical protein
MASQAFFYNAIFFTYALVLGRFFGVPDSDIGLYLLPFAAGNFLGPLLLGPAVRHDRQATDDRLHLCRLRRLLLATRRGCSSNGTAHRDRPDRSRGPCLLLRVGRRERGLPDGRRELPARDAGLAIAIFYAFGTGLGGVVAPWWFGVLIGTGERSAIAGGYLFGAALMIVAAIVTLWLGFAAERQPLEALARPLTSHGAGAGATRPETVNASADSAGPP